MSKGERRIGPGTHLVIRCNNLTADDLTKLRGQSVTLTLDDLQVRRVFVDESGDANDATEVRMLAQNATIAVVTP